MVRHSTNCSILLADPPPLDRPVAAPAAGRGAFGPWRLPGGTPSAARDDLPAAADGAR
jgi:hypothetical protein